MCLMWNVCLMFCGFGCEFCGRCVCVMNFCIRVVQLLFVFSVMVFVLWFIGVLFGGFIVFELIDVCVLFGDFGNFCFGCWFVLVVFIVMLYWFVWVDVFEKWFGGCVCWGVFFVFILYFVVYKIVQYLVFEIIVFDLLIFYYVVCYVWVEGLGFVWGFNFECSFFSEYFEFIVLWVVLFDMVFCSLLVFLIFEVVGVGFGLWFIVGCLCVYGICFIVVWIFGVVYVMNFMFWQLVCFDFYFEVLLFVGIFVMLWVLKEKCYGWFVFVVFMVLCFKEDMVIVLVLVVVFVWFDD